MRTRVDGAVQHAGGRVVHRGVGDDDLAGLLVDDVAPQPLQEALDWPTTARVSQGLLCSSGPRPISYSRKVSAPYAAYISSGLTMFFSDLPILPNSRVTGSPCQ